MATRRGSQESLRAEGGMLVAHGRRFGNAIESAIIRYVNMTEGQEQDPDTPPLLSNVTGEIEDFPTVGRRESLSFSANLGAFMVPLILDVADVVRPHSWRSAEEYGVTGLWMHTVISDMNPGPSDFGLTEELFLRVAEYSAKNPGQYQRERALVDRLQADQAVRHTRGS